ncbi:BrnA antitoxin family protein [Aromatoleum anaerobium]|uniref:BrnA antitoxin of type II toxin-antitoxin system n=1 Tax=Aromatoleum anaerobium TaxID=182180 RepID=A0ABX1PTD4_9RHOO|nr:BrnA antitoxin family protein [Aromatoleum anaerobium]MCK0507370.1 BrnA antitoxin family protein [Aromatoleum anaerobium]
MNANKHATPTEWVDPDDAPELTDEFFEKATPMIGGQPVTLEQAKAAFTQALGRGRPKIESPKVALTVRYDADIVEAFKATGKGWQTRMNAALKDWLKTHSPT